MSDVLLHTIWTGSVFNFWYERLSPRPAVRVRLGKAELHPYALGDHALREACAGLTSEKMVETSLQKRMPADGFGALRSIDPVPDDAVLHFFRLPAVRVECVPAIPALLGLSGPVADDTRAWQLAARWAVDLMARGRLVPTLMAEGKIAAASWDIALDEDADAALLDVLERAIPPSAVLDADTPRRALLSFVRAAVRRTAQALAAEGAAVKVPTGWPPAAGKWATALLTGVPNFTAPKGQLEKLENEVSRWTRPVVEARRPTLCFRLLARGEGRWRIEVEAIVPRAADVPPLPVSRCADRAALADTPWAPFAEDLAVLMAAQLAEAEKVFEALARSEGDHVALDDAGAVDFVLERAPALQEKGFAVLVPAGMPGQPTKIDLQLEVEESGELGREALLRFGWQFQVDGEAVDLDALLTAADKGRQLVKVGERWIMLGRQQAAHLLAMVRGQSAGRLGDALRVAACADDVSVSVKLEGALARLGDDGALGEVAPPRGLQATLRPYQLRGVSWLAQLRRLGLGACLADDMGLGKTIQVVSLLLLDLENGAQGPVLLVCPTSLVGNWRREIERFAPSLRVLVHHGGGRDLDEAFERAAARAHVVITTYGLVSRDLPVLRGVRWRGVVLDEAQNVKNPQTAQAQAVRELEAGFRIALTGTPVENRLTDLWSIVDFLEPGMLGPASAFQRRFATPVRNGDTARLAHLRRLVAPLLLRRCKTDPRVISDLPEKLEMKVYCSLTDEQARLYRAVTESLLDRVGAEEGMQRRSSILAALMRLKQICNHPACLPGEGQETDVAHGGGKSGLAPCSTVAEGDVEAGALAGCTNGLLPRSPVEVGDVEAAPLAAGGASRLGGRSGKLERLEEMLEEVVDAGERALVFTQFARWGERLCPHLRERLGCEVLWLHGGTSRMQRDEIVERFAGLREPAVLVLSLKAGGTGLNLVNANHVFHYDRWWNPAVENQATDRAFRIGQTRNVQVHKLICEGTLEESIDRLIESKTELAEGVLGTGEGWLTEMSTDDLRDMLELRGELMEVAG